MEATCHVSTLSDASFAFVPEKPASTEEERRHQMEKFSKDGDAILEPADKRFYRLEDEPGERLNVLMTLYALKHRSDFSVTPSPALNEYLTVLSRRIRNTKSGSEWSLYSGE